MLRAAPLWTHDVEAPRKSRSELRERYSEEVFTASLNAEGRRDAFEPLQQRREVIEEAGKGSNEGRVGDREVGKGALRKALRLRSGPNGGTQSSLYSSIHRTAPSRSHLDGA